MNIVEQFKKGWKTSEFWISLLTKGAAVAAIVAPEIEIDTEEVALLISVVLGGDAYGGYRTWLKRKRLDVLANPPKTEEDLIIEEIEAEQDEILDELSPDAEPIDNQIPPS